MNFFINVKVNGGSVQVPVEIWNWKNAAVAVRRGN
jgi:hypothetical protein